LSGTDIYRGYKIHQYLRNRHDLGESVVIARKRTGKTFFFVLKCQLLFG